MQKSDFSSQVKVKTLKMICHFDFALVPFLVVGDPDRVTSSRFCLTRLQDHAAAASDVFILIVQFDAIPKPPSIGRLGTGRERC